MDRALLLMRSRRVQQTDRTIIIIQNQTTKLNIKLIEIQAAKLYKARNFL